jgi:hypothetical protein
MRTTCCVGIVLALAVSRPAMAQETEAAWEAEAESGQALAPAAAAAPPPGPVEGEARLPVSLQKRPLSLPRRMVRVDTALDVFSWELSLVGTSTRVDEIGFHFGGGYGVTDDFEVGALLVPLQVTAADGDRDVWFGDMVLYGMHRLTRGAVELGARVELSLPTNTGWDPPDRPVVLTLGLPVLVRLGEIARLDTGVQLALVLRPEFESALSGFPVYPPSSYPLPTRSASGVPVVLTVNLDEHVYMGLRTGLSIYDLQDPSETIVMPLGFHFGGTVAPSGKPLADLTMRFEWPYFLTPAWHETVSTDVWQVTFAASFYIDTL